MVFTTIRAVQFYESLLINIPLSEESLNIELNIRKQELLTMVFPNQ